MDHNPVLGAVSGGFVPTFGATSTSRDYYPLIPHSSFMFSYNYGLYISIHPGGRKGSVLEKQDVIGSS